MKNKNVTNINIPDLREQIAKLKMEISTRRMKNTNAAKNLKITLARALTNERLNKLSSKK